jgi:hypothetical protein
MSETIGEREGKRRKRVRKQEMKVDVLESDAQSGR